MCAPDVPSPTETAAAQTGTNVMTAIANGIMGNVNQVTPYGRLTYTSQMRTVTDPTTGQTYRVPHYTATQTLSPTGERIQGSVIGTQRNLADTARELSGNALGAMSRPFNLNGIAARQQPRNLVETVPGAREGITGNIADAGDITRSYGADDFSADRQRVEDALMTRMQGRFDRDRSALEDRLASQGIGVGSEAYSAAMDDFTRGVTDARMAAILGAGDEQARMTGMERDRAVFQNSAQGQQFGQNAQQASFQNAAAGQRYDQALRGAAFTNASREAEYNMSDRYRNSAINERLMTRTQPLNEIMALLGGSQVQQPSFMTGGGAGMATTDYAGIVNSNYGQQLQRHNANQSNLGGLLGAGAALIEALPMLSDRRAKTDIKKVGKTDDGQNVYSYRYKSGGPVQMGLMAQEVEKKRPEAVTEAGGYKLVNYGLALAGGKK